MRLGRRQPQTVVGLAVSAIGVLICLAWEIAHRGVYLYDTAGTGEQVVRLPVTGNETVLDAVASLNGLSPVANRCRIYVVRPAPNAVVP